MHKGRLENETNANDKDNDYKRWRYGVRGTAGDQAERKINDLPNFQKDTLEEFRAALDEYSVLSNELLNACNPLGRIWYVGNSCGHLTTKTAAAEAAAT